jgi:hypothetical protein
MTPGEAIARLGEAYLVWARAAMQAFRDVHDASAALYPRRHWDRCRACNPAGNPGPLAVNGHEYRRRQKDRQRRKKR